MMLKKLFLLFICVYSYGWGTDDSYKKESPAYFLSLRKNENIDLTGLHICPENEEDFLENSKTSLQKRGCPVFELKLGFLAAPYDKESQLRLTQGFLAVLAHH